MVTTITLKTPLPACCLPFHLANPLPNLTMRPMSILITLPICQKHRRLAASCYTGGPILKIVASIRLGSIRLTMTTPLKCRVVTQGFNQLGHPIRNVLRRSITGEEVPIKGTNRKQLRGASVKPTDVEYFREVPREGPEQIKRWGFSATRRAGCDQATELANL
ncbi:hypothetical protein BDV24DRAFT_134166 [Aspergillus arachidicola]|uniref:Uncharacterized protein n=1 Tax=Aspergillus arachidicola TaxID=656916 RepID=A0A5N6Y779_9EURO|nr:hypothetical protein BDV24DRAFT_134166 [Aspergillus arachidicola]